ncbi:MAG: DUF4056 domain-containing protein [Leadbetterella sp.]
MHFSILAKEPLNVDVFNPPPRIIRTCCAFGNKVGYSVLSFIRNTDVTSISKLGKHVFMGAKSEHDGIIYTHKGGFIDTGHMRDIADITAYMYTSMKKFKPTGKWDFTLGREGGLKSIHVRLDSSLTDKDLVKIAGKIAYDLSVWHEISTWYGASFLPLIPERYSSFSVEDAFSNLLGAQLGMKAILSEKPYEEAMTELIAESFQYYNAVNTYEETTQRMDQVEGKWWSVKAKFPSKNVLKLRLFDIYGCIHPMLIDINSYGSEVLCVPTHTEAIKDIDDYYLLTIKANFKMPLKDVLEEGEERKVITQKDFPELLKLSKQKAIRFHNTTD